MKQSEEMYMVEDEWQRIAAVLVMKLGGSAQITEADLDAFQNLFPGDLPCMMTTDTHEPLTTMKMELIPMSEAQEMAGAGKVKAH